MLDVLVHKPGAAWNEPFDAFTETGFESQGPFFLIQAQHPLLVSAGRQRPDKIISIASIRERP
ncbi:hypothetical protein JIR23_06675 [Bradyrhizobium diazoefficiens]|nr:hypothetical protein [Bradyrhizobium diazoefficiens]QQN65437.1 hypothetical protein JIR23_06675 [Bradyrhizobium diazoefficiens]